MKSFLKFFLVLFFIKILISFHTISYNVDGDVSIPWLMANDWETSKNTTFFWGQQYMGTSEVWLLHFIGRIIWPLPEIIPYQMDVALAQLFLCLGAALIYSSLLRIDPAKWSGRAQFWILLIVLGFLVPIMEKRAFGVGQGYSFTTLAAGIALFLGTKPQQLKPFWYALGGVILGHSLYICRLHMVLIVALFLVLFLARNRLLDGRLVAFILGLGVAKYLEIHFQLQQDAYSGIKLLPLQSKLANLTGALRALTIYFGVSPFGTVESEHALWFVSRYSLPWEDFLIHKYEYMWIVGLGLLIYCIWTMKKFKNYLIFLMIIAVNISVLVLTIADLDRFSATRYLMPSALILPLLPYLGESVFLKRIAFGLKTTGLIVYLISALLFVSPLEFVGTYADSKDLFKDKVCVMGHGGHLTSIFAINNVTPIALVDGWRLKGNYSKAIDMNDIPHIRETCKSIIAIETPQGLSNQLASTCQPGTISVKFDGTPSGMVPFPAHVRILQCQVL